MHRSGTSLVTRLLEQLGLFVGREKDENNESLFFQELNDWILCQAGATWDNPLAIEWLIEEKKGCDLIVEYLRSILDSPVSRSFWGRPQLRRSRAGFEHGGPWGWKDPRNTFTLPLWLKLFADAKVIHVRRHGVDVAHSLRRRNDKTRQKMQATFLKLDPASNMPPAGIRLVESPRCLTLEGGFSLWEEYMTAAARHTGLLGPKAREFAYEDLLSNPTPIMDEMAAFCGLRSSARDMDETCAEIRADRAFSYRNDATQRAFADSVGERLKVFGY